MADASEKIFIAVTPEQFQSLLDAVQMAENEGVPVQPAAQVLAYTYERLPPSSQDKLFPCTYIQSFLK